METPFLLTVFLFFLSLTRIIPVLVAAAAGLLIAPKLGWRRITGACVGALAVLVFNDLYFATASASPWRWLVLLPPAAVWLAPWYVLPFRLYRFTLPRSREELEPFDPALHPLSEPAAQWMRQTAAALEAEGFVPLDDAGMRVSQKVAIRFAFMDHASQATRATLLAGVTTATGRPNEHLTLVTVLADGRRVAVTNDREPRNDPPLKKTVVATLPDVCEAGDLLAAFRAFARETGGGQACSLPLGTDGQTYRTIYGREADEEMVARGWQRRVGDGYRLSLRAACLTAWSRLFPLRQLRLCAVRREQDRTLRRLGLPIPPRGPDPSPVSWWLSHNGLHAAGAAALLAFGVAWPWLAERGGPGALIPAAAVRPDTVVPARLPAGFTVPADFPGAVRALERLAVAPAKRLTEDDDNDAGVRGEEFTVPVAKERAKALVAAAQPVFLAQGYVLFQREEGGRMNGEPEELAIFRSRDPVEAVLRLDTNGANYGIFPPQVAAWVRERGREHPLTVTSVGSDYVEARFRGPVSRHESRAMAARVARFCPDVVTQGTRSVRALAREIQRSRTLYCWWD